MGRRNLSQAASNAADKFFTAKNEVTEESKIDNVKSVTNIDNNNIITHDAYNAPITNDTNVSNVNNNNNISAVSNNYNIAKHTHITQPTNKSKHYDTRGKRSERYGILLDKQLKEDLQLLCNATNSRSLNDFIVTVLLEYVEEPKNCERLNAYKELLKL